MDMPKEPYNALGISNDEYDPYSWFDDSPQEFGSNIASLLASGNAVTLCTDSEPGILAESHCYMVDHVTYVNGMIATIVLRNPWGTDGPTGDGKRRLRDTHCQPGLVSMRCDQVWPGVSDPV